MELTAVIGKNFGDEGKGLATDHFAAHAQMQGQRCLVIRHNGGAQAGHTVDRPDRRFVFHQYSSGSFRRADTYWAETFLPDLYKLPEEAEEFCHQNGFLPRIYSSVYCRCVIVDDVALNMALESARGKNRHGSCGMGINEAVVRSEDPDFQLPLHRVLSLSAERLYHELKRIRREYVPRRLEQLSLSLSALGEYAELLTNDNVLYHAAEGMKAAEIFLTPLSEPMLTGYDSVIFEGAQGLMLDEDNEAYAPHLTSSRTGLSNPMAFCRRYFPGETLQAVYVTRSYVTRHGAGPLPYEGMFDRERFPVTDETNLPNDWQGTLRFALHGTEDEFHAPVRQELEQTCEKVAPALMITHLNETDGKVCTVNGAFIPTRWCAENPDPFFRNVFLSDSPYAESVRHLLL